MCLVGHGWFLQEVSLLHFILDKRTNLTKHETVFILGCCLCMTVSLCVCFNLKPRVFASCEKAA